jgi:uncharacterized protein YndB with AHSA1/START domain
MSKLTVKTEGDLDVVITRRFDAPPELVYKAHLDPKLIQKWCSGPSGWTMTACEVDVRPGGRIRYDWANENGNSFYLTGEYIELVPNSKIVFVERWHMPDPSPDKHNETTFTPDGDGTLMTIRMRFPDAKSRAETLATGMEHGMEASYVNFELVTKSLSTV